MTQHEKIADYLKNHGSITPAEAWDNLHVTKLSTRIGEMIKAGYDIKKSNIVIKKDGETIRFTKYEV